MPSPQLLAEYLHRFAHLHRNKHPVYGEALHKPLLLLAVLDEIERGAISENCIRLTPELVERFHLYWRLYAPTPGRVVRLEYPFRHLREEGFWQLVQDGEEAIPDPRRTYSLNGLNREFDGARFSPDLWELLQDPLTRNALRNQLFATYFNNQTPTVSQSQVLQALTLQIDRLKANAQGKFRPQVVREQKEDGYYVRHTLFPRVIKELYDEACAVCGLRVRTDDGGGIIDAAHIMPFALFHNDDPRNGIAFCKNHHWGFDAGWFSLRDDYTIIVSPHLQNAVTYIAANAPIYQPRHAEYSPASEALEWHRKHVFLS